MDKLIRQLGEALEAAHAHLDYCGYGDSYERGLAKADKLEEKLDQAVYAYSVYKQEQGE